MEKTDKNQFIRNENGEGPSTAKTSSSQLQKIRQMGKKEVTKWFLRFILKRYAPTFSNHLELLNLSNQSRNTKFILIVGSLRCGKSKLFESITGVTGPSGEGIHSGK